MTLLSTSEKFFEWIDSHRTATYRELNSFAEKNGVKVDSLLRRTRNNDNVYKGGLIFVKYGFDGKPIKGSQPFKLLKVVGKYHLPTVMRK